MDAPTSSRGAVALVLYVLAVVLFILAALGAVFGSLSELDLIALGLGSFALAHVVP